jgi:hypothetical protein
MNLEDILLSEINQAQKDEYCTIIDVYMESKSVKLIEAESRIMILGVRKIGRCWPEDTNFQDELALGV